MEMNQTVLTLLKIMLAVVMFGMGLGLSVRDFRRVLQTPWQALIGTAGHFILMPLAAFIVVKVLNLPFELALGVIIVGSCPSGTTSNLINYFAKADVALAIVITSLSTLLCPILTPLIVNFLGGFLEAPPGKEIAVPIKDMIGLVVAIIAIPVGLGMLVRKLSAKVAGILEKVFKIFGILFLLFMIILVLFQNRDNFWSMVTTVGLAVVLHNTIAFALGYFVPKLLRVPEAQSRTIAIEMAVQNTTLGMTLAVTFFNGTVAMPAALFSLWMYMAGMTMALIWARRPAPLHTGEAA
ncbi:MAG: bile acid:sodium symporter family protein [Leptospirales bacterium]|nr:bile acid:sodium symporter family protein [Leptospirales bacterium]